MMQRYNIPQDYVLYSRNLSFGRQILNLTHSQGVDVKILAPLGRFIEIGKRNIQAFQHLAMQPFAKNLSYHSLDLRAKYQFDPNASYVIAGGFRGIGKSLASWFAERGARHLILLSRSGATTKSARLLVEDLSGRQVRVAAPRCDVVGTMLLIKGCIQASMVLRDRLFQNMSYEDWHAVMAPKIKGTWNLHNLLSPKMDFFVILSSLGALIGSKGQSQYNAASTFQDAFARYRRRFGERFPL
ncbi:KR domain-containing protein [Xylariaceae sp. FL1651]|nr:KR domain-containing protein [Xylariaceae sp. FL1651]